MPRPLDLMGQRFGRLVVVDQAPSRGRGRRWTCHCDCGESTEATTNALRNGHTKSCGCTQYRLIDMRGQRFGHWTVGEYAGSRGRCSRWHVVCDCGTKAVRFGSELRSGRSTSCGCLRTVTPSPRRLDLSGQVFGLLTVVMRVHGGQRTSWLCRCACGKEIVTTTTNLTAASRQVRSCGCVTPPNHPAPWASNLTMLIGRYRRAAKARQLEWSLSREEAAALFLAPCHYCGAEPSRLFCEGNRSYPVLVSGIDRKDPARGYASDNVVPCCIVCNVAKVDRSYESYVAWVLRSAEHLRKNQEG